MSPWLTVTMPYCNWIHHPLRRAPLWILDYTVPPGYTTPPEYARSFLFL